MISFDSATQPTTQRVLDSTEMHFAWFLGVDVKQVFSWDDFAKMCGSGVFVRCHQVLRIWGDDITGLVHAEEVYRPPWKIIGPYLEDHLILVTPPSMEVHGAIQASKVYNVT